MTVYVLKSQTDLDNVCKSSQKVVIDFSASWCAPCKKIAPKFEELSKKYTNIAFCKVDIDVAEDLAQLYNIDTVPTFYLLNNGKKVNTVVGANLDLLVKAVSVL